MAVTLELAISAIRSGRREEGRQLLNLLIQENPNNAKAWLWMSSVVDTDEQRARCLYHVLAIDPNSELARRGLNVLGIVVSDSRPVKIPRDSKPIEIPNPTSGQERRPFLINPQTIANELPFTPVTAPFTPEKVEASPSVLSIDVETEAATQNPASAGPAPQTRDIDTQPLPDQNRQNPSGPVSAISPGQTQQPASQPVTPTPAPQLQNPSEPVPMQNVSHPGAAAQPQNNPVQPQPGTQMQNTAPPSDPNAQSYAHQSQSQSMGDANQQGFGLSSPDASIPNQTRPSQQVPVVGPNPQAGMSPNSQGPSYPMPPQEAAGHANITMGMPIQSPQNPSQPVPPPIHSNTTMGMPLPAQNQQAQHPSEPVPVVPSSGQMGMMPYGQPQPPSQPHPGPSLHSSSTMMMPTYSEAEARARLAASQPFPTGNPNFAYQSGMAGDPMVNAYGYPTGRQVEEDDEEGVNILAVIIFGTLSVTALGGLGMLILLVFTAPSV